MRDTDDHYKVLQVDPTADSETIEAAYRALAKKHHPDRNPSPDATRKTQRLNRARDVLLDPRRRAAYDRERRPAAGRRGREEEYRRRAEAAEQRQAAAEAQVRQEADQRRKAERHAQEAQVQAKQQEDRERAAWAARAEEQQQRAQTEERLEVERQTRTEAEQRAAAAERRARRVADERAEGEREARNAAERRAGDGTARSFAWPLGVAIATAVLLAIAAAMLWNTALTSDQGSQSEPVTEIPAVEEVGPPVPTPLPGQSLPGPGFLDDTAISAAAMRWPAGARYVYEMYEAERQWQREQRRPGRVFRDCERCPWMVVLPPGSFRMGSDDGVRTHQPVRDVRVQVFALARYEVTVGEYASFVTGSAHVTGDGCYVTDRTGRTVWDPRASWRAPGFEQFDEQPVVCVSWRDAHVYARWVSGESGESYRLASEAEWEYAARAGTEDVTSPGNDETTPCGYGNGADRTTRQFLPEWRGNTADCRDDAVFAAPVGSYAPNAFGLFDMLGNAWEWTEDCWHDSYRGAPSDAAAWTSAANCRERVLRGGSWQDGPRRLHSAIRNRYDAGRRSLSSVGFRVARTMD